MKIYESDEEVMDVIKDGRYSDEGGWPDKPVYNIAGELCTMNKLLIYGEQMKMIPKGQKDPIESMLIDAGFDKEVCIKHEWVPSTDTHIFYQFIPYYGKLHIKIKERTENVENEAKSSFDTVEGLREWARKGCPLAK